MAFTDAISPTTREYRPAAGRPLRFGTATDTGRIRRVNEDAFALLPEHGLFVVADGLGGYAGGAIASRAATHAMSEFFRATAEAEAGEIGRDGDARERLESAVKFANTIVWNRALGDEELAGMGTTVAAIAIDTERQRVVCAHVGDSRIYRIHANECMRLTRDHSLARLLWMSDRDGKFDRAAAAWGTTLFRALGMGPTVEVETTEVPRVVGDRFLLVSDGLTQEVSDAELSGLVLGRTAGPAETARRLVDAALAKGGRDNVTVVVVDI